MLNLILDELFYDLAHKLVLWLKFYKSLSLLFDKLKENLNSLSTFISTKLGPTTNHLKNDYNYMTELGTILDLLNCLEKHIFCLMIYDNEVYNYINEVVVIVKNTPQYVSGIVKVECPLSNSTKSSEVLDICKAIKGKVFPVGSDEGKKDNVEDVRLEQDDENKNQE